MNNRTRTYKSRSMNATQTIGIFFQNAFSSKLRTLTHIKKKNEDLARFDMDCKNYVQTSRIMRVFIDTFIGQCANLRK